MELIEAMAQVARGCGALMTEADQKRIAVREKSSFRDLVTEYDVRIQNYAVEELRRRYPEAGFICEEADSAVQGKGGLTFVIDPIDGTANFVHHFRHSCTSIACISEGRPVAAAIYNPFSDELFTATANGGAYLNGREIRISEGRLSESLVLFGTSPYRPELTEETLARIRSLYGRCLDLRRSGSAALDLCYVAAGRAGLYFELSLSLWDYAAGALIVKEAGGVCTQLDGTAPVFDRPAKCSCIAGPRALVEAERN
ncbi:MAG: inositol monophosphatase [Oscillospiraceae bacterium]|nr:inositol monophosphatase [Oscillospiraceae bacterium]